MNIKKKTSLGVKICNAIGDAFNFS
jgi:hypothetical protein